MDFIQLNFLYSINNFHIWSLIFESLVKLAPFFSLTFLTWLLSNGHAWMICTRYNSLTPGFLPVLNFLYFLFAFRAHALVMTISSTHRYKRLLGRSCLSPSVWKLLAVNTLHGPMIPLYPGTLYNFSLWYLIFLPFNLILFSPLIVVLVQEVMLPGKMYPSRNQLRQQWVLQAFQYVAVGN